MWCALSCTTSLIRCGAKTLVCHTYVMGLLHLFSVGILNPSIYEETYNNKIKYRQINLP